MPRECAYDVGVRVTDEYDSDEYENLEGCYCRNNKVCGCIGVPTTTSDAELLSCGGQQYWQQGVIYLLAPARFERDDHFAEDSQVSVRPLILEVAWNNYEERKVLLRKYLKLYRPEATTADPVTQSGGGTCITRASGCGALCPATFPTRSWENWSFDADVSPNDGLVVRDVHLGNRSMIREMSVPYFTILTSKMEADGLRPARVELECTNDADTFATQLAKVCESTTADKRVVEAQYLITKFPNDSQSCLEVTQRFEFLTLAASLPFEPSGELEAQRVRPIVSYQFIGRDDETLKHITIPLRIDVTADGATNNSVALTRDQPDGIEFVTAVNGNPLPAEERVVAIRDGKRGDRDNVHVSFVDQIQTPVFTGILSCPHGASEALHMHWYWGRPSIVGLIVDLLCPFSYNKPLIPDGSTQTVEIGIVKYNGADEADPIPDWLHLADDHESLQDGTKVLWLSGTSSQPSDTFFGFGAGFEAEVHYLGPGDVSDCAHVYANVGWMPPGEHRRRARLTVMNVADFELLRGPVYLKLPVQSDGRLTASATARLASDGLPYFTLTEVGRDGVLHPKEGGLISLGEETMDSVDIEIEYPTLPNDAAVDLAFDQVLQDARVYSGETP